MSKGKYRRSTEYGVHTSEIARHGWEILARERQTVFRRQPAESSWQVVTPAEPFRFKTSNHSRYTSSRFHHVSLRNTLRNTLDEIPEPACRERSSVKQAYLIGSAGNYVTQGNFSRTLCRLRPNLSRSSRRPASLSFTRERRNENCLLGFHLLGRGKLLRRQVLPSTVDGAKHWIGEVIVIDEVGRSESPYLPRKAWVSLSLLELYIKIH